MELSLSREGNRCQFATTMTRECDLALDTGYVELTRIGKSDRGDASVGVDEPFIIGIESASGDKFKRIRLQTLTKSLLGLNGLDDCSLLGLDPSLLRGCLALDLLPCSKFLGCLALDLLPCRQFPGIVLCLEPRNFSNARLLLLIEKDASAACSGHENPNQGKGRRLAG